MHFVDAAAITKAQQARSLRTGISAERVLIATQVSSISTAPYSGSRAALTVGTSQFVQ